MKGKSISVDAQSANDTLESVADKLLKCVSTAADQLEYYAVKNKLKTKTVEYNSETGKVECEQAAEQESIGNSAGIIDRTELRHLVTALKDIKEIYEKNSGDENRLEELIRGMCDDDE